MPPPLSARTSTLARTDAGSWASARSRTVMWSALSLRSHCGCEGSRPAAPAGAVTGTRVVDEREQRVMTVGALERRRRRLFHAVSQHQAAIEVHWHQALRRDRQPVRPGRRAAPARAARSRFNAMSASTARRSISRLTVGSDAT